jgi:hypothetical protein
VANRDSIHRDSLRRSGGDSGPPGPSGPVGPIPVITPGFAIGVSGPATAPFVSVVPEPDSWVVVCVDQDQLILLTASDVTGMYGYTKSSGVPATDRDAALALARTTAFRSQQRVGQVVPKFGNNATLLVLTKPRAAGATYKTVAGGLVDQGLDWMNNLFGYQRILIRATSDFVNDLNDKITCGFQIAGSTNTAGYSAGATSTTFLLANILTAAGAAPALPAESSGNSAISAKRIRFSATTPTVALRNAVSVVYANGTTSITPGDVLPAVPAFVSAGDPGNDIFFIEEPALRIGSFSHYLAGVVGAGLNATAPRFFTLAGFASVSTSSQFVSLAPGGEVSWSGIELSATNAFSPNVTNFGRLDILRTYIDELGVSIPLGVSMRTAGNSYMSAGKTLFHRSGGHLGANGSLLFNIDQFAFGESSLIRCGVSHDGGGGGPGQGEGALSVTPLTLIGRVNVVAFRAKPMRITHDRGEADRGAIDLRASASATIEGVDFANITHPCIKLGTLGGKVEIDDLTSIDGGNTNVVVDISVARKTIVNYNDIASISATATLGDIRLSGGVIATFAGLDQTNYTDVGGNDVLGNAGEVI